MMDEYVAVPISLSNRRAAVQMDALLNMQALSASATSLIPPRFTTTTAA